MPSLQCNSGMGSGGEGRGWWGFTQTSQERHAVYKKNVFKIIHVHIHDVWPECRPNYRRQVFSTCRIWSKELLAGKGPVSQYITVPLKGCTVTGEQNRSSQRMHSYRGTEPFLSKDAQLQGNRTVPLKGCTVTGEQNRSSQRMHSYRGTELFLSKDAQLQGNRTIPLKECTVKREQNRSSQRTHC